jgi:hypothetical protein
LRGLKPCATGCMSLVRGKMIMLEVESSYTINNFKTKIHDKDNEGPEKATRDG